MKPTSVSKIVLVTVTILALLPGAAGHKAHKHSKEEKLGDLFGIGDLLEHFASLLSNDTLNEKLTKGDKSKKDKDFLEFQLIDVNKDSKLDGLEILNFWIQEHSDSDEKIQIAEFEELTDTTLKEADLNLDGYVNFKEFVEYNTKFSVV